MAKRKRTKELVHLLILQIVFKYLTNCVVFKLSQLQTDYIFFISASLYTMRQYIWLLYQCLHSRVDFVNNLCLLRLSQYNLNKTKNNNNHTFRPIPKYNRRNSGKIDIPTPPPALSELLRSCMWFSQMSKHFFF